MRIHVLSIVAQSPQDVQSVTKTISAFMHPFGIVKLLSKFNAYKEKGISVTQLFIKKRSGEFSPERNQVIFCLALG